MALAPPTLNGAINGFASMRDGSGVVRGVAFVKEPTLDMRETLGSRLEEIDTALDCVVAGVRGSRSNESEAAFFEF